MLILIIAGGPDKGRIYELTDGEPIVLGREGDQVKLNDRKVSREHARLWSEGGQWYLKDLGSRHGTFRNHAELERGQHAKIKDGDYLQVGNTVMVLGRMNAGQNDNLALMGAAAAAVPASPNKSTKALFAAAVVVLAGFAGFMAWKIDQLQDRTVPRDEFTALQEKLIAAQRQQTDRIEASIDKQTDARQALLDQHEKLTSRLDQTGEAIDRHNNAVTGAAQALENAANPILEQLASVGSTAAKQQLAIERLGEMLAHQQANNNSGKLLAAVTDMQELLADQPDGDKLVAKLQEAIDTNAKATGELVQTALAEHRRSFESDAIASAKQTEALVDRMLSGLAKMPTRQQIAEEVRLAVAESKARDEQFMRLVLAELRRTGDQISTDVAAAVGEDAGQAQQLMKQVVAELDKRPTGEQLAADLRAVMNQALANQDANGSELSGLMKQVLSELEQRPTSEQIAADLRRYIGEDAQRTELLVARVMSELNAQPTAEQIAKELQATDNESAAKTASLLEEVLAKVEEQSKLATQIDALRKQIETIPGQDTKAVRDVLARLEEQDRNNTDMLKSIAELRAAMPKDLPDQLDKVLAKLDEQVRTEQMTDAIEKSIQRLASAQNKQTQETLESLTKRLDALPTADQLEDVAKSQEALAKLLDESDARDAIGQLRTALEQLAQKQAAAPEAEPQDNKQLNEIIAMLKKREKAELLLAELHDAVGDQSAQAESIKKELLTAVESVKQPENRAALRELLAIVKNRLVTDESIRQAIRDEMRGTVLPSKMALSDARDVTTTSTPSAADPTPRAGEGPTTKRLTQLESAYKRSFETGQPVTVGAGVVDATTGEVSKGRLIDPAVAKTLGFETWRDWYLTDRHAEQMRLQQQAIRQRNQNESKDNGTIKLPPVINNTDNARPELDTTTPSP